MRVIMCAGSNSSKWCLDFLNSIEACSHAVIEKIFSSAIIMPASCSSLIASLSLVLAVTWYTVRAQPDVTVAIDVSSYPKLPSNFYTSNVVPGNFLGLSIEYFNPQKFAGAPTQPHRSFTALMRRLTPVNSTEWGGPVLRIGGSSEDNTAYNGSVSNPSKYEHIMSDDDILAIHQAVVSFNGTAVMGINFEAEPYNNSVAIAEAQAVVRVLSRVTDEPFRHVRFELGNEPELYTSWEDYVPRMDYLITQLYKQIPELPLYLIQAGAFASTRWLSDAIDWAIQRRQHFHTFSFHQYEFGCWSGILQPSLPGLMNDSSTTHVLLRTLEHNLTFAELVQRIATQTSPPLPVVLGEGNSDGCEGWYGVTDTFAQALWLIDYTLLLSSINVSGMYFYTGWTPVEQFLASPIMYMDWTVDAVKVYPMYYGMWMFARSVENHGRHILHQRMTHIDPKVANDVKTYTLMDQHGVIRVIIIHKGYNEFSRNMTVSIDITVADVSSLVTATIIRLTAPSVISKTAVDFGGFTFDGTTDGYPAGRAVEEYIRPSVSSSIGSYQVVISPASALIMTIPLCYHCRSSFSSPTVSAA